MPCIRALLFVSLLLDDPTHIAIADPVFAFLDVPSPRQLLIGLALRGSRTTREECKFLHLLVNVRSRPLVGVKKQSELIHQYLYPSAGMKTHFLA